jgi:hypothetical protein
MAKIIGTTPNGFVLDISRDEVAKLIGYYSPCSYSGEYRSEPKRKEPEVGDVIKVAEMYNHLRELASHSGDLRAVATKLRVSADLIDTLPVPLTTAKAQPDKPVQT